MSITFATPINSNRSQSGSPTPPSATSMPLAMWWKRFSCQMTTRGPGRPSLTMGRRKRARVGARRASPGGAMAARHAPRPRRGPAGAHPEVRSRSRRVIKRPRRRRSPRRARL